MSIENSLERIAAALETIAANTGSPVLGATPVSLEKKSEPIKVKAPKAAPVVAAPAIEDPFAGEEEQPKAPAVSFEQMSETLKKHAKTFGSPVTIKLMKDHGADPKTPKLATIPEANFAKITAQAITELEKAAK